MNLLLTIPNILTQLTYPKSIIAPNLIFYFSIFIMIMIFLFAGVAAAILCYLLLNLFLINNFKKAWNCKLLIT
jgi:hypothetical protein